MKIDFGDDTIAYVQAKKKARGLGITFEEYICRLIVRDLKKK